MNVARLERLAEALDGAEDAPSDFLAKKHGFKRGRMFQSGGRKFNMRAWSHGFGSGEDCATVCCVAGWTCGLFGNVDDYMDLAFSENPNWEHPVKRYAASLLELDGNEADALFLPHFLLDRELPEITASDAAEAVRRAAAGDPPEVWWEPPR